jgi:hypothetical protein
MNRLHPALGDMPSPDFGLDFDAVLTQVRSTIPEHPETIYFVGPDDPSEDEIQASIASLLAEGRFEEGARNPRHDEEGPVSSPFSNSQAAGSTGAGSRPYRSSESRPSEAGTAGLTGDRNPVSTQAR